MNPQNPWQQPTQPPVDQTGQVPVQQNGWQQPAAAPQPQAYTGAVSPSPEPGSVASQYPVDYLNQIAAPNQVNKLSPLLLFGGIAAVILLAVGAVFFLIQSAAPPDISIQLYTLNERVKTLSTVTSEQGKKITQSELSSINSTLGTVLTSMSTSLGDYMKARGLKSAAPPITILTAEKSYKEKLSTKLNDSYLTGTLDRSYANEMAYQVAILKSKMLSIKAAADGSKAYNDFYATSTTSLGVVSTSLDKFQSTK